MRDGGEEAVLKELHEEARKHRAERTTHRSSKNLPIEDTIKGETILVQAKFSKGKKVGIRNRGKIRRKEFTEIVEKKRDRYA